MKKMLSATALVTVLIGGGIAQAAPVTFFGEDLGQGESTRLLSHPNADAAQTAFLANIVGVSVEDFESPLLPGNVVDFGGGLTADLNGTGSRDYVASGTNGVGRYPISGDYYWESGGDFSITFSTPIAAFGFYGIDIGDFNGQVVLGLQSGGTTNLNIGNSTNIRGGSVLYFGFYDLTNLYTSITFDNTAAGRDYFGFDDFIIGGIQNVVPSVPEPATMLLFGTGLAGLAAVGRRRKNS